MRWRTTWWLSLISEPKEEAKYHVDKGKGGALATGKAPPGTNLRHIKPRKRLQNIEGPHKRKLDTRAIGSIWKNNRPPGERAKKGRATKQSDTKGKLYTRDTEKRETGTTPKGTRRETTHKDEETIGRTPTGLRTNDKRRRKTNVVGKTQSARKEDTTYHTERQRIKRDKHNDAEHQKE